jgi:hypothetical protein
MKRLLLIALIAIPLTADPVECTLTRLSHASDAVCTYVVKPAKKVACKIGKFAVWLYRGLD